MQVTLVQCFHSHMADNIAGDPSTSSSVVCDEPARIAEQRIAPHVVREGPLRMFLVVSNIHGLWSPFGSEAAAWPPHWPALGAAECLVIGVALACSWLLASPGDEAMDDCHRYQRQEAARHCRARRILGFVDYPVDEFAGLVEPVVLSSVVAAMGFFGVMRGRAVRVMKPGQLGPAVCNFDAVLVRWQAQVRARLLPVVVNLGPAMAHKLVEGSLACLHTVAISQKLARQNLLVAREPSKIRLAAFVRPALQNHDYQAHGPCAGLARLPRWAEVMLDPELVLDWLEATSFVKDIRQAGQAASSFARLFARSSGLSRTMLQAKLNKISYTTLRHARVRLDCVAMMVWRIFWKALLASQADRLFLYIFCDASPQRGAEMFASTVDIYDGKKFWRVLLPCIALSPCMMDAIGKSSALLWQLWLIAGPSYQHLQALRERVISITTDQGVERKIPGMVDMLPDFFKMMLPSFDLQLHPPEPFLWPNCLAVPGWKHAWDLLLQKALSSLQWFPLWLQRFKAIIHFFRIEGYKTTVVRGLRKAGMNGLADVVAALSLPHFAEWRWGTLHWCLVELLPCLDSLILHFDPTPFASGRDKTGLTSVLAAFACDGWRRHTDFVAYVTRWLVGAMQWGAGCDCHENLLKSGESIACDWKGRRLVRAHAFVVAELTRVLEASTKWSAETWMLSHAALIELQGCIRATCHLARRVFAWLDRLPYLLARLGEPGVARRCVEQWESCRADEHHRVSRKYMAGALRADIDAVRPDGSGISARLDVALMGFRGIPFDDSVAEGPHARSMRIARHSRRSCWPWIASSLRLGQNLRDARELLSGVDADLRALWCSHTSIIRVGGRWPLQGKKISRQKFLLYVYHMSFCNEEEPAAAQGDSDEGGDDDEGGDSGDDGGPPPAHPRDCAAHDNGGPDPPGDGDDASGGGDDRRGGKGRAHGCGPSERPPREPEIVKLLRQYLHASLQVHCVISVEAESEGGEKTIIFVQVLALKSRPVIVPTFRCHDDEDFEVGLYSISVQPYSRWSLMGGTESFGPPESAECFIYQDPCLVDILAIGGTTSESRKAWMVWETKPSDIEGCLTMHSPQPLRPRMGLRDKSVPVLALIDALESEGFEGEKQRAWHSDVSPKLYDARDLLRKRSYFQCVLALEELLRAGVHGFQSGHAASYYELLLRTRKLPTPGLAAKQCKRQLASAEGDVLGIRLLDCVAPDPVVRLAGPRVARARAEVAGDPNSGDEGKVDDPPGSPEALVEVAGDDDAPCGDGAVREALGDGVPRVILGQHVSRIKGRSGGGWSYFDRISVRCNNWEHPNCLRSRSLALDRDLFGPRAAELFLACWLQASDHLDEAAHKKHVPSRADCRLLADQD
jgi:hypothetical protein